jgi:hypothetical protein
VQQYGKKWGGQWLKEQGWLSHRPSKKPKAISQDVDIGKKKLAPSKDVKKTSPAANSNASNVASKN